MLDFLANNAYRRTRKNAIKSSIKQKKGELITPLSFYISKPE